MMKDYANYMTGITEDMPDEIIKIAELIELSVFEPVFKKNMSTGNRDCHVVYLMNDAVESYIVLEDAIMTGEYLGGDSTKDVNESDSGDNIKDVNKSDSSDNAKDVNKSGSSDNIKDVNKSGNSDYVKDINCNSEEEIEYIETAGIQRIDGGYMLIVNQENNGFVNTFTIRFSKIYLRAEYYNYGDIGHFWIKDYEYMRQLEYELATLRDKRRFMGDSACNEKEKVLSLLADYPPIKAYPSVPDKYYVPYPDSVDKDATEYLLHLCIRAADKKLYNVIKAYGESESMRLMKKITKMLVSKKHSKVVFLLINELRDATKCYNRRKFAENEVDINRIHNEILKVALEYREKGREVLIYREEPFIYEKDSVTYKEQLLVFDRGFLRNRCSVITIS